MKKGHVHIYEPFIVCLVREKKNYFLLLDAEVSSEKASSFMLLETQAGCEPYISSFGVGA